MIGAGRAIERLRGESPVVVMTRGHSGSRVLAWSLQHLGVKLGATEEKPTGDIQDRRFTRRIKRIAIARLEGADSERDTQRQARSLLGKAVACKRWLATRHGEVGPADWGWKFPETCLIAPVVRAAFPEARYVHLIRDGRDIAFKAHLTDDPGRTLGRRLLGACGALDDPAHVRAAKSWAFQERILREFFSDVPAEHVMRVRFEDLVASPVEEIGRCAAFLGLAMTDACRDYLADKIDPGKIAQHRREEPELVAQVESAIGEELAAAGYALSGGAARTAGRR